jgi:autotransporter-associated beta strand protein
VGNAILAIPTISNSNQPSPIGTDPSNAGLNLGNGFSRGTLLLTGTNPTYSSNRKVYLFGQYANGGGGAIGVQNAATNLTLSGEINGETLIKTGPGTLTLNNNTNNYAGGTYVEAGTLTIAAAGAAIPANTDVTVLSGAALQNNGDNGAAPLRTVTLNGGTLQCEASAANNFYLNRLVTGTTGGTIGFDVSPQPNRLYFVGSNAGATINGNTGWTGGSNAHVTNASGATADLTIAPTVSLASQVPLGGGFRILGGGTLYMTAPANNSAVTYTVSQGRLRVDDLSVTGSASVLGNVAPGLLTLDGGALQYTGSTVSTPMPITLGPAGGTVEVSNAVTTLTATGTFSGGGGWMIVQSCSVKVFRSV